MDTVVKFETWLTKSFIIEKDIDMNDYNVYRTDGLEKGGSVSIYVKSKLSCV